MGPQNQHRETAMSLLKRTIAATTLIFMIGTASQAADGVARSQTATSTKPASQASAAEKGKRVSEPANAAQSSEAATPKQRAATPKPPDHDNGRSGEYKVIEGLVGDDRGTGDVSRNRDSNSARRPAYTPGSDTSKSADESAKKSRVK